MGETIHTDINTIISEDRSQLSHRIEEQLKGMIPGRRSWGWK